MFGLGSVVVIAIAVFAAVLLAGAVYAVARYVNPPQKPASQVSFSPSAPVVRRVPNTPTVAPQLFSHSRGVPIKSPIKKQDDNNIFGDFTFSDLFGTPVDVAAASSPVTPVHPKGGTVTKNVWTTREKPKKYTSALEFKKEDEDDFLEVKAQKSNLTSIFSAKVT